MEPTDLGATLRRYRRGAWRHRWAALGLTWLVCLLGWGIVFNLPNKFESNARLYVDGDAVLTPLLRGLTIDPSTANQVEVLQRTLLSRPNVEKLIAKTDLDRRARTPEAREELIRDLTLAIKVVPQTRNLFTITYRDTDPRLAYDVVRTIIALFMESAVGNDRAEMESAQKFIGQQIASYEAQLRQAEQHRSEFQQRNLDLMPNANGLSNAENARVTVTALKAELQDASTRQALLLAELAKTPPLLVIEPGGGAAARSDAVAQAERDLAELRTRDTERHPDVVAAVHRLAIAKASAARAASNPSPATPARSIANPVFEQLKVRAVDGDAKISSLQHRLGDATAERDRLEVLARRQPEAQAESANIDRDYTVLRHNYEELLARRESMRIARAASKDADKIKLDIVDPPTIAPVPVAPPRALLLGAVQLVALAAAAALVMLLVRMDSSFQTIGDLRPLGLPILGAVSAPGRPRSVPWGAALGFAGACCLLLVTFSGLLLRPVLMRMI